MYLYPVGGVGSWQFFANKEWLLSWWPLLHWWLPCTCSHCNITAILSINFMFGTQHFNSLWTVLSHLPSSDTSNATQAEKITMNYYVTEIYITKPHSYINAFLVTSTVGMSSAVTN